jgi:DnaJ family protein C protein 11
LHYTDYISYHANAAALPSKPSFIFVSVSANHRRRVKELREENAEFITQKKSEAEDAIRLMTRSAENKMSTERSKNGLIILQADYGVASAFTDRGIRHPEEDEHGGPMVIDVTIPLQSMTQDSRVTIPGGRSKSDLLGFYDPCIGESKKLRIRYLFREKVHEVTVTDKEVLRIPMKGEFTLLSKFSC